MALDSITLYHLVKELQQSLIGTRIDKVNQPEKEEIHLLLRSPGQNHRLLLNASSTNARLHLGAQNKKNPLTPPMFCMILRKHLESGKIIQLEQIELERVIRLTVQNYNERGDLQDYHLYLEIMGKHSNLILVDTVNNQILDGIKRYSHLLSRHREVLPGRPYVPPPVQHKFPSCPQQEWTAHLLDASLDKRVSEALLDTFQGLSPELSRELTARADLPEDMPLDQCGEIDLHRLYEAYSFFFLHKDQIRLNPCVYHSSKKDRSQPLAFTILPYEVYRDLPRQEYELLNEALRVYYEKKTTDNHTEAQRGSLRKVVQDHLGHTIKKLQVYQETILKAEKGLSHQKSGELLTANLYRLSPGLKEVVVEDYYQENVRVTIPLDPYLSGIENAQRYYKLYNKAKSTIRNAEPLLEASQRELSYLQSLMLSIEQSSGMEELAEIHQELMDGGYVSAKLTDRPSLLQKSNKATKRKEAETPSSPHRYLSRTGQSIIVGRNNRQNDRLTWREANLTDLWLHVKNIPGSHVIVPLPEDMEFPDDQTLLDAAALAVYFSQARGSSQVPVDYTHVKQIKKPRGAKPGMVVYDQNWSLLITPKEEDLARLLASESSGPTSP